MANQAETPLMLVSLKAGPLQFNVAQFFELFYDVDEGDRDASAAGPAVEEIELSLKDLRQLGVLLPREEWGEHDLSTTVNKRALSAVMIIGALALVLIYLGNGKVVTFGGIGLFMVFMWQITRISLAAIEKQAERFRETRQEIAESGDDTAG